MYLKHEEDMVKENGKGAREAVIVKEMYAI